MEKDANLGRSHFKALCRLNETILKTCGDRVTPDLNLRLREVFDSWERWNLAQGVTNVDLADDSLGRNFITAQCTLLLAFVYTVGVFSRQHEIAVLKEPLILLWRDMNDLYSKFFVRPASEMRSAL